MSWEAVWERSGFLRSDAHKSVSISGRNDDFWDGARKNKQKQRQQQRQEQRRNTGISLLRRQSVPPSVEMTFVVGWSMGEQTTTTAEIDSVVLVAALVHTGDAVVPAEALVVEEGPEEADAERTGG